MSDLWFWGNTDSFANFGFESPDPVTASDAGWTWDVEFVTNTLQTTYARSSINSLMNSGGGWFGSGIVAYTTRDLYGIDHPHPVGQSNADGVVDSMSDTGVVSVTFGWYIGSGGGSIVGGHINMEIWIV